MGWFDSVKSPGIKSQKKANSQTPEGLWKKCSSCGEILQTQKLEENFYVCPYCEFHFRLPALKRLELLLDEGQCTFFKTDLQSSDPLNFVDKKSYKDRIEETQKKHERADGTMLGVGRIKGQEVAFALMDFFYMGGSMGAATGEKIASCMDLAHDKKIPALVISSSGGARMQEGIISLMQMAKVSASRKRLRKAGIPYISLLTDPTTGGVAASFAMQGDIHIAEPKALIGFAGPRVIEQSIRQSLPEGFQRAEFLQERGFVDRIVHRHNLKDEIGFFCEMFSGHLK